MASSAVMARRRAVSMTELKSLPYDDTHGKQLGDLVRAKALLRRAARASHLWFWYCICYWSLQLSLQILFLVDLDRLSLTLWVRVSSSIAGRSSRQEEPL